MSTGKVAKVGISGRIAPQNYEWLKAAAARQERSANWLLDKVLTEARLTDEAKREDVA
ncbi:hypothetical protein NUK34_08200 [Kerstersia gyiorum]|uniref:hypothetical protein n=1 Tax=Kerstersia gyiorum TaxID=206506 RepID=UPI00214F7D6A|nr:hypothetical protein [Kerstersia gyiorum]MCR4158832.1 hypothetical protein [Kerstersia gyiorum]